MRYILFTVIEQIETCSTSRKKKENRLSFLNERLEHWLCTTPKLEATVLDFFCYWGDGGGGGGGGGGVGAWDKMGWRVQEGGEQMEGSGI